MKNLRAYIAVVLAATFLAITFQSAFIQISYDLNKAYIAQELCVNKDRPEMKCEGKCYLNKQLTKTEQQNSQRQGSEIAKPTITWSAADLNVSTLGLYESYHSNIFAEIFCNPSSFVKEIEHPPA